MNTQTDRGDYKTLRRSLVCSVITWVNLWTYLRYNYTRRQPILIEFLKHVETRFTV